MLYCLNYLLGRTIDSSNFARGIHCLIYLNMWLLTDLYPGYGPVLCDELHPELCLLSISRQCGIHNGSHLEQLLCGAEERIVSTVYNI